MKHLHILQRLTGFLNKVFTCFYIQVSITEPKKRRKGHYVPESSFGARLLRWLY